MNPTNPTNPTNLPFPKGALHDILVLDLSRMLPGPYCSMILADHGARVIAIEDKRQYAADGLFLPTVQRNKEHMALDLKSQEGRAIFGRLVRDADVLIEGFRPGVAGRLGVDYAAVRRIKDDIIYCSISGYGQTGPHRDRAGHDVNYLGYAGVLDLIGQPQGPPAIPGIQIADIAGGGLNAVIGILLALVERRRSGQGQHIDISMADGSLAFLPVAQYWKELTGDLPRRSDNMLSHRYACYNTYATADGRYMAVGALEGRFWKQLCHQLDLERYADLQYDESRRLEIIEALRTCFLKKGQAEWESALADLDLCVSAVRTIDEALDSALFRARDMVMQVPGADGASETALGVPVKLSATPGSVRTPRARFGEHTHKILREYGYAEEQIRLLEEKKII
ncbi:MAG: CoA transferase [Desulfobacteraceae bacterium]|nr:MAG: CoA transferase [Desulfobacteraceae bacterium]